MRRSPGSPVPLSAAGLLLGSRPAPRDDDACSEASYFTSRWLLQDSLFEEAEQLRAAELNPNAPAFVPQTPQSHGSAQRRSWVSLLMEGSKRSAEDDGRERRGLTF